MPDSPTVHDDIRREKGLRPGGFGLLMTKASVDELLVQRSAKRSRLREISR